MRVLHIGSGYPPIGGGGLTRYALDLMAAQAAAGHDVSYLCSGDFDLGFRPRIRRWKMGAVQVFELRNPRVGNFHLGRQEHPELELAEPDSERLAAGVFDEVRPEVVHLHNLLGWPIGLLGLLAARGIPLVYTAQNYHAICPTTRLYDEVTDEVCTDFIDGRRCARCNSARASGRQLRNMRRLRAGRLFEAAPLLFKAARGLKRHFTGGRQRNTSSGAQAPLPSPCLQSETFRRRRAAFTTALNSGAFVVGMSRRVSELLTANGLEPSRVRTMKLTLADIGDIIRREPRVPGRPVRFGLLNKLTHLKGADVLAEAFRGLDPARVQLVIYGVQSPAAVSAMRPLVEAGIAELRGSYERARINEVLSGIDVGLVPSIWEEPYGYVGPEFLATGIPVLGSRIGGIPDYIEDGVNGRLLPARDASAWKRVIIELADGPETIAALASGAKPVKTTREHLAEMDSLYAEAMASRRSRGS